MDRATANQFYAYMFLVILLLLSPAMCENEFNYDIFSKNGPLNWGNKPGWHLCKNGTRQSPINLERYRANIEFNSGIQINYQPANATLNSTDHDIVLKWTENAGYISINGTQFHLDQCHWHSPSEHLINGIRYGLELHLVHYSASEQVAVIGILYDIGNINDFISKIGDVLMSMGDKTLNIQNLGIVDPTQVTGPTIGSNKYFRYNGSLTTPPCHESVTWSVFTQQESVTWEQIKLLRRAVDGNERYRNSRPVQPLNNRPVKLYKQHHPHGN